MTETDNVVDRNRGKGSDQKNALDKEQNRTGTNEPKGGRTQDIQDDLTRLKSELRQFYLDNPPDLSAITDINRRHFRMVLPSGRFLKIKDVIRTTDDLQKWLQRLAPLHVYYTTATWLNPVILSPRPKERGPGFLDSGIILSHDIAFDIDRTPFLKKNIESARSETLRLVDHMTGNGYRLKYIAFSGSKGFHAVFHDTDREIIPDIFDREMNYIEERTRLTEEILSQGIDIDTTVTKDTRRIIRVPGTINTRTGFACTVIDQSDLESSFREFIRKIPHLPDVEKIPAFQMPKLELPSSIWQTIGAVTSRLTGAIPGSDNKEPGGVKRQTPQTEPSPEPGYFFTTYLQSNVLGIKDRHAVLLGFKGRSLDRICPLLSELITSFDLTDFHIFRSHDRTIAISLTSVQKARYQRILESAGVENTTQLEKYHVVSARVGPLVNRDMKEVLPPVSFIETIPAPPEHNDRQMVSRGHLRFLRKHGVEPYDYPNIHGSDEFKVVDAVLKM